jgi:hypothetical protein
MGALTGGFGCAAGAAKGLVCLPHQSRCDKPVDRIGQLAGVMLATSVLFGLVHKPSLLSQLRRKALRLTKDGFFFNTSGKRGAETAVARRLMATSA